MNSIMKLILIAVSFCAVSVMGDYRTWTDHKGNTLEAKFLGFSHDLKFVICENQKTGKIMAIMPCLLSREDRKFVEELKNGSKGDSYFKVDGKWITESEKKEREENRKKLKEKRNAEKRERQYISRAESLIKEKSPEKEGKHFEIRVFQKLTENTGLCHMGDFFRRPGAIDPRDGYFRYESSSRLFMCLCIPNGRNFEGAIFEVKDLYWAGTYAYKARSGYVETVDILCPEYKMARFSVRIDNKLYDSNDHRFAKFSKQGSATPSNGGASRGTAESAAPSLAGFGSGFIITKSGYLVTNYHVIEGSRLFKVRLGEDLYQAEYVKHDSKTDLAVLKISGTFEALKMSANRIERLGREVFTMGFPKPTLQGFSPKITKGVISSDEGFQGDVRDYQIDAAIQPGNSGGPLADENGNLVGVVVASLKRSQNVNYAVKKSYLLAFLDSIPECSTGIETAGDEPAIPFEDAVAKVQKSCVQILVYK